MTTAYDRRGEGPALVLVHGIGSSRRVFAPVIELLAVDHEVVSIDLPGFGDSPVLPELGTSPAAYAEWLALFVDALGLSQPHVVGNSLGGAIALESARQGYAGAATAFSPIGFWGRGGQLWCQGLTGSAHAALRVAGPAIPRIVAPLPARVALFSAMTGRPWRLSAVDAAHDLHALAKEGAFRSTLSSFGDYTWSEATDLGALPSTPVTIAWGTRDVLLPQRTQAARAAALVPSARHVALSGCGHVPFADDAALCASVVRQTDALRAFVS